MQKSAAKQASRTKFKWAEHVARLQHTRYGRRQLLCGTLKEAREAEAGQVTDGKIFQQTSGATLVQSGDIQN
jgi:hypothetical protein